jgi:hypothetical protein
MKILRNKLIKVSRCAILLGFVFSAISCQTVAQKKETQQQKEAIESMRTIAGSLSGKQLSDEELRKVSSQIEKNPEAQSAVESITQSMGGAGSIKYCPVDGKRFAPHIIQCPAHQVELKNVDE